PTLAQDAARKYVPFDIDPNYQKILQNRLAMEQQLGPFKDLIKQILADPAKMPFDAAKIKDMKLEDPKFKKALRDWLANDPQLKKLLDDWTRKIPPGNQPADMKKLQQDVKRLLDESPKK